MVLNFQQMLPYLPKFIDALGVTLKYTALSLVVGIILGLLIAIVKLSKFKVLKSIANGYTTLFRGIPVLVQLFIVYFATPQLTGYLITAMEAGVITFGLNTAALTSEVFRGGIASVPRGQKEAATALSIPYRMSMKDIIIPQALKTILPALVNEAVNLLKYTSLVSTIGAGDLMRTANLVTAATYKSFEPLLIAAAIYFVLVIVFSKFANMLERRLRRGD